MSRNAELVRRAALHSALGDAARLAIVDALVVADASPSQLQAELGMASNLLAHHLRVLEGVGVLRRVRSEGDRRRSYLTLVPSGLDGLHPAASLAAPRIVFVCTENAARSQLAAALWAGHSDSRGHVRRHSPGPRVHPAALAAARRHHLALHPQTPQPLDGVLRPAIWSSPSATGPTRSCPTALRTRPLVGRRPRPHRRRRRVRPGVARADRPRHPPRPRRPPQLIATRRRIRVGPKPTEAAMTSTWHRDTLSIDQQLALKTAAGHLSREFDGTFGKETIERFLHSSYDDFAGRAVVLNFLPLLAEKFARQRLRALAKVEGKAAADGRPVVLFLCTHNAGRSQMALGFFNHLAGDRAVAWSGGSEPASTINPSAIEAMAERGIDIAGEYPSPGPTKWSALPTS